MEIVRIRTTVLPGHRIEISTPDLPEGLEVEVEIHPIAAEQAAENYSQPDPERDAWQGGDIVEH